MSAGVIMNVLLSITLLFVFNVAFPKKGLFSDVLTFEAGSKASEIGLVEYNVDTHEGDFIHFYSDPRYVGTNEEGYIPNKDYKEQNKDCLKPIWRKMKEANIFGPFVKLLRPHINQGLFDLFLSEDVYI
jgi:hypothetical protein